MSALPVLPIDGDTYDPELDGPRLRDQMLRVYVTMSDGEWRSLSELSALTGDPEASVSARLRDLRKKEFGGYTVNRRRRGLVTAGCWEYRLSKPEPRSEAEPPKPGMRSSGFLKGLMFAARIVARSSSLAEAKFQLGVELRKIAYRAK